MTITEAQAKIDAHLSAGLISNKEARWFERMIRRTGGYGNKWSFKQQSQMRENLMKDFA